MAAILLVLRFYQLPKVPYSALKIQPPSSNCHCKMAIAPSTAGKQIFSFSDKRDFLSYGIFETRVRYILTEELQEVFVYYFDESVIAREISTWDMVNTMELSVKNKPFSSSINPFKGSGTFLDILIFLSKCIAANI